MGFMLKDHHVNRERDVMSYFNEAHYPDPTADEAMRNIEKRENA